MREKSHSTGWCEEHQKLLYSSRRAAKHIARQHYEGHKSAYPCTILNGYWHVGELSSNVIQGHVSRSAQYRWENRATG